MNTFSIGGIHPPGNKLSAKSPIEAIALTTNVAIPLSQHIGAPAEALVAKGDKVKVGTLIGKASGFVSANVHSSVSGTVSKVDVMPDGAGLLRTTVFITTEGDEWEEDIDRSEAVVENCTLSGKEIIDKISAAGIVGMGGATFPTHVKLSPPPGNKADILIINAVECEPYLTADHALMLAKGKEIIVGTKILMKALEVNRAVIGIESNKPDAIAFMKECAGTNSGIEVMPLKMRYPQGGEKQLIDAVTKRQVKSGALPISVGAVVQNVGTVFAVYEAVQKNKPLIERIITVTGKGVAKPSNFLARIGTPVNVLIETAGGTDNIGKVIGGGPMMGRAMVNIEAPVTKGSSGILVLTKAESERKKSYDCIRCAKCVRACPMGLEPYLLTDLSAGQEWEEAEKHFIFDCIECGCCSYTCPANRPLLDFIRFGKNMVMGIIKSRKK